MSIPNNYNQSIYTPLNLEETGASSPKDLEDRLALEAHVVRRRRDASLMARNRQTARSMAAMVLKTLLDEQTLERVELTDDQTRLSGPNTDYWKPEGYTIRIPTDKPEPNAPVTLSYIVSSMLAAARDAIAAHRYLSHAIPSPADPFTDEVDAIRVVTRLAANTKKTSRIANMGLGDFDLEAVILAIERSRIQARLLPMIQEDPEDYESCLVKLDTAAGILERQASRPARIPVRKPEPGFLKGRPSVVRKDLPGIAARMAAYITPAPEAVTNIMNNPPRLDRLDKGYEITIDCTPDNHPATDDEVIAAAVLPFRMAMSYMTGRALEGNFPDPSTVTQPELDWLQAAKASDDDGMIRDGIEFFALVHAMSAAMEDDWAVEWGLMDKITGLLADQGWLNVDQWMQEALDGILVPTPAPDPSPLADAYASDGVRILTRDVPLADQPLWQSPSLPFFPDQPCVRNCDLTDLSSQVVMFAMKDSFAAPALKAVSVNRNSPLAGAALTQDKTGLAAITAVGKPTDDGQLRDPSEDRDAALEPASEADILQTVLSAAQAARRTEQAVLHYGFAKPDSKETALLNIMTMPEGDARDVKMDMDAQVYALRKGSAYFRSHPEFLDIYGFDYESAAAAWRNLFIRAGGQTDDAADTAEDAAKLIETLSDMI